MTLETPYLRCRRQLLDSGRVRTLWTAHGNAALGVVEVVEAYAGPAGVVLIHVNPHGGFDAYTPADQGNSMADTMDALRSALGI